MKKNYLVALLALVVNLATAQIEPTTYRGAFDPNASTQWTDSWTNFNPQNTEYTDAATVVNVTTDITTSTTWTSDKTYKLTGLIYVRNNATLTIQPGTIIKGVYSNTGTALIVTKGAKLNAIGTVDHPIVFTSAKTVAEGKQSGDWGGVILLGKAHFNLNDGINNIEGITATANTEYGGGLTPDDNDNSGTMKYCRIEFPGFVFSPNNEINGLTLGAVGRGTTIDYVQVSYSGDDSFEWFGGSVNTKHLVAFRGLDDDFDTDNGYKGVNQFLLGIKDPQIADNPAVSNSEAFESDNNAASTTGNYSNNTPYDKTTAIFTNCTLIGPSFRATLSPSLTVAAGHERPARLRRATEEKIYNSIFLDFKSNFLFIDGSACVTNAGTIQFRNNIIAGTLSGTYTGGVNPTSLNTWFGTTSGNSYVDGSAGILTKPYDTTSSSVYTGLDYRPGTSSIAATGADFSNSYLSPYLTAPVSTLVVADVTYCQKSIATPLTATPQAGYTLKWYTVATGGKALATAPTPKTTAAGTTTYYVSQTNGTLESARLPLAVTVYAAPTEVVSVITGVCSANALDSAVKVGPYVGSTTTFSYSVSDFTTGANYLWTVPTGVTIVSGQGTKTLVVDFSKVAPGAGDIGTISIQASTVNGCVSVAKTLKLSKALVKAPKVALYDLSNLTKKVTTIGQYLGTSTSLLLSATPAAGTSSYVWELPAGVNLDLSTATAGTTTTSYFSVNDFITPSAPFTGTGTPASFLTNNTVSTGGSNYMAAPFLNAGTGVGLKYWSVAYQPYTLTVNEVETVITVSTAKQYIFNKSGYPVVSPATYAPYGTRIESNQPSILVNFNGVTNSATTLLYIGVKAKNGVGASVTNNSALADSIAGVLGTVNPVYTEVYTYPHNANTIDPSTGLTWVPNTNANATSTITATGTTSSTAALLKLTAALPKAPAKVVLTDGTTTTAITKLDKIVGTSTVYTLTATPSSAASSYAWNLPSGVTQLSGENSNVITVKFDGNFTGVTSIPVGVKAVNVIGQSTTEKVLTLSASLPATVKTVTGQLLSVCGTKSYSFTASPNARWYVITAPSGSIVTCPSNTSNTSNELTTTDLSFSVQYPSNIDSMTTKVLSIVSGNGVGNSIAKSLTLTTTLGVVKAVTGLITFTRAATQTYSIATVLGATDYTWYADNGATISGNGTTNITVDFSAVPTGVKLVNLSVTPSNDCTRGVSKAIKLTNNGSARMSSDAIANTMTIAEIYPNPSTDNFNLDVTAVNRGELMMTIYSFNGSVISSRNIQVTEGFNTINENISSLSTGIYFVKLQNTSNNEIIVKKLVKN